MGLKRRVNWYILDGRRPKSVEGLLDFVRWLQVSSRHVASDMVGDVHVSTVFLGLDHSGGDGPPVLFETMVSNGKQDGHRRRCSTWDEAEWQHKVALRMVTEEVKA